MEWVKVARIEELPQGHIKLVKAKGKKITLANIGGNFYAVNDKCSHHLPITLCYI
jgi:nitrite reductase/ring-hydroxylating ferredoxin subunit